MELKLVGGVTPKKGGQKHLKPYQYLTLCKKQKIKQANATMIYVPPKFAASAISEAINSKLN